MKIVGIRDYSLKDRMINNVKKKQKLIKINLSNMEIDINNKKTQKTV